MNTYLVFLEQRDGEVKAASIDLWNAIQDLAAREEGALVYGVLPGCVNLHQLEHKLTGSGIIYHADEPCYSLYNADCYLEVLAETFHQKGCTTLFLVDTVSGRELASRLSVRLQASLVTGCSWHDSRFHHHQPCWRPIYAGSVMASFIPQRHEAIYTIASLPKSRHDGTSIVHSIAIVPLSGCESNGEERRVVKGISGCYENDLGDASVIISGGRGMGGDAGFKMLEETASRIGAAVGASRSVVDEGIRPHSLQIGQTGRTVAPKLYIACGISGSMQHLAGIAPGTTIVAINSDPHAPIFSYATYGMVGDVHQLLPALGTTLEGFLKSR